MNKFWYNFVNEISFNNNVNELFDDKDMNSENLTILMILQIIPKLSLSLYMINI
jgi:hypothetical protein